MGVVYEWRHKRQEKAELEARIDAVNRGEVERENVDENVDVNANEQTPLIGNSGR